MNDTTMGATTVQSTASFGSMSGLVWNCRDILPALLFDELRGELPMRRQTYAACARAMKAAIMSGPPECVAARA